MKIEFVTAGSVVGAIAVPVYDKASLSAAAQSVDTATSGAIGRAIAASRFKGGAGETLEIIAPAGIDAARIVLFGLGDKTKLNESVLEKAAAAVVAKLLTGGETIVTLRLDGVTDGEGAARAGLGARLAAYRFDQYRTKLSADKKPSLSSVLIAVDDVAAAKSAWKDWAPVAEGVDVARELLNQPPNVLNPETYAKQIEGMAKLGLEIEILDEAQMLELGMHSLLGVGQAS
ncbi:MAG: leucyl aminopeptidase, partial [Maricaulis sp.]